MNVLCVPIQVLPDEIVQTTGAWKIPLYEAIPAEAVCWMERAGAEKNFSFKHIIPYVLFTDKDGRFACYPRHGSETRLAGLYSCGIGGHIEETDKGESVSATIKNGLLRELKEEIRNFDQAGIHLEYLGLISEKESEVGLVHLGVVWIARCTENFLPVPSEELCGLFWEKKEEIEKRKTELWTKLAFSLLE